jgi:hypothetical protein
LYDNILVGVNAVSEFIDEDQIEYLYETWEIISLYMRRMTNYIDLNWKTEEKFNIDSNVNTHIFILAQ